MHYSTLILGKNLVASTTLTLRQNLINQARASTSYRQTTSKASNPSLITTAGTNINPPSLYPNANPSGVLPNFSFGQGGINNLPGFAQAGSFPDKQILWDTQYIDDLSYIAGKHVAAFGLFLEVVRNTVPSRDVSSSNVRGNYNFSQDGNNAYDTGYTFANALIGSVDSYSQNANDPIGNLSFTNTEIYLQDEWRVLPQLTMSGGVRFYHDPAPHDLNNQLVAFVPSQWTGANAPTILRPALNNGKKVAVDPATGTQYPSAYAGLLAPSSASHYYNGLIRAGQSYSGSSTSSQNSLINSIYTVKPVYYTPRAGFNYAFTPSMVLKGGSGIYYDRIPLETTGRLLTNPRVSLSSTIDYTTFDQLAAASNSGLNGVPTIYTVPIGEQKLPANYGYSVEVQRQIGTGTLFGVAYVGSQSRHLNQTQNINPIPVGTRFITLNPQNVDPTNLGKPLADNYFRVYPGLANINQRSFVGFSNYNSMQVSVSSRIKRYNLTLRGNYTYGKALGSLSQEFNFANSFPTSVTGYRLYGPLTYDVRNSANFWFIWNLPQVSQMMNLSGFKARALGTVTDGWELSGNIPYASGRGYSPGFSINGNPEITGSSDGSQVNLVNRHAPVNQGRWAAPLVYTFGHSGCSGCLYGPSYYNFNVSASKNFRTKDRVRICYAWKATTSSTTA